MQHEYTVRYYVCFVRKITKCVLSYFLVVRLGSSPDVPIWDFTFCIIHAFIHNFCFVFVVVKMNLPVMLSAIHRLLRRINFLLN